MVNDQNQIKNAINGIEKIYGDFLVKVEKLKEKQNKAVENYAEKLKGAKIKEIQDKIKNSDNNL